MGYEVIPINYNEYEDLSVEGLDEPYPYDRWEDGYYGINHAEGSTYEIDAR